MANRSIELTLKANVSGMVNGLRTARTSASNAARDLDNFRRNNEQAWNTIGRTMATAGAAITAGVGGAVKAAIDWETAWAGVQKVNEGTEQQMTALEEDLRELARTLPTTHQEIAAVAEAAGRLGVGVDDVSEFTETMINLGETTNLSAEEAATSLARFSNITGTSFSDVGQLGSALVGLGNNFAASESEILAMSERLAAAGTQAGLTDGEIMGLASAMSAVGIEAQAGGTAMTMTFNEIDAAVREGGDSLADWADVAGVSASEFAEVWKNDPAEAITMVVEGLGRVQEEGGSVSGTLEELGINGIRQADALRRLAGDSEILAGAFAMGNEEFDKGSALAEEAAIRYETAEAKISVAWNNIKDAAITAGGALLPVVSGVADSISGLAGWFAGLSPAVAGTITALSGVAGVTAVAAGGLMLLVPRAVETVSAFRNLYQSVPAAAGAMRGVARAAGIASAAFIGFTVMRDLANNAQPAAAGVEEVANALNSLSNESDAGSLNDLFTNSGVGPFAREVDGLAGALSAVDPSGAVEHLASFGNTVMGLDNTAGQSADQLEVLDQTLATMDASQAAEHMRNLREEAEEAGRQDFSSWEELSRVMPEYAAEIEAAATANGESVDSAELLEVAMGNLTPEMQAAKDAADSAAKQDELQGALEDVGVAADGAVESLTDYLDILFETGLAEQSSMQAQSSYQESLRGVDDTVQQLTDSLAEDYIAKGYSEEAARALAAEEIELGHALNEAGDAFDLTTEAGSAAQDAFINVADSGMNMATAMADAGASQDEIQEKLEGTYEDLISTAGEFGITGEAADELARSVLGIEDDVSIETWMSEEAKETADETANSVFGLPDDVDIDSFMSDAAYRESVLTKSGIDEIPKSAEVSSYMEDDAFIEALATRAAVLDIPEEDVVDSFMSSAARDEADATTAEVLGIPEGASISSWMSDDARSTAISTNDWLNTIDGKQTSSTHTHNEITQLQTLRISSPGDGPGPWAPGGASGGVVGKDFGLPGLVNGGRLPYTGLGTDQILGLSSGGRPTALVDDGEWVVRESSADKYNGVLDRINRDHPSVQHLAGYAGGGTVAARAVQAQQTEMSGAVQAQQIAAAMQGAGGGTSAPAMPSELTGTLYMESGAMLGQVRMAMRDPGVARAASQSLAQQGRRDGRAG